MNSQYPIPSSSSSFTPLNPNFSNPQFNFFSPSPPSYPQTQTQTQIQKPISDLPNSLSSLKTLLQSSHSTLQSFSSFRPSNSLLQCPSNPHHWVPPSSLFHHSLHCPSPLDVGPLLDTLHYPKTLKLNHDLIRPSKFVQPLNDPISELCFSLDDYVDFGSNFFYQGCPGVVSSVNDDATRRIFTLPGVLSVECSNFVGNVDSKTDVLSGNGVRMLPSEIWVVQKEIELWSDYPTNYSYSVLRALCCLKCVKENDLLTWLIANSPRFGVVIDVALRDHMSVLVRLCLKATIREAALCYGSLFKGEEADNSRKQSLQFECPVMIEALIWLASQLSILYGRTNAKCFVISMLRHLLRNAAACGSVFPIDRKLEQTFESSREMVENKEDDRMNGSILSRSIFVYQIAAAIAALHERSLLEERIRALQNPPPLNTYQRMAEHQDFAKKADEERQKRSDYRPLIEHDSLPFQQQNNQEATMSKTREELLAEERDYKRRRMSYRGKKLKRTTKEVMRDIIEEYMEAIKQTGGIGGLAKGDAEGETSALNSMNFEMKNDLENFEMDHELENNQQGGYRKLLESSYKTRDKLSVDASPFRKERQKSEYYYYRDLEDQRTNEDRYSRDYHSRSSSRDRRHSQSKEQKSHRRNVRIREMDEDEFAERNYSSPSKSSYNDQKKLQRGTSERRDKRKLESPDRHRWNKHDNDERGSYRRNEFSDRYDPSENDQFIDSQFPRPES